MEDKADPKSSGNSNSSDSSNSSNKSTAKKRAARNGGSGKARSRKPAKRRGLSQQRRVQLSYLLLSVIAASLLLLMVLIPDVDENEMSRSALSRTETGPGPGPEPETPQDPSGPDATVQTDPLIRPAQPTPPEHEDRDEREQSEAQDSPSEEQQDTDSELLAIHPLGDIKPAPPGTGTLYLVIDDVGYNLAQLETYLELPIPMTFALLPGLEYTHAAQERIVGSSAEMILHQPIEPVGDQDPGPGALYVGMQPEEMRSIINRNLDQIGRAHV